MAVMKRGVLRQDADSERNPLPSPNSEANLKCIARDRAAVRGTRHRNLDCASDDMKPVDGQLDCNPQVDGLGKRARWRSRMAFGVGLLCALGLAALWLMTGQVAMSSESGVGRDAGDGVFGEFSPGRLDTAGPAPRRPFGRAIPALAAPLRSTHSDADGLRSRLALARTFNGRPIRAAATLRMRVTAYSPDHRSCGASADGITASGYSVFTNGGNLVAADPRVLPLGSLVSVPGYDQGGVVPVLDVGGAIKGNRLDVLFPTHATAMEWGVRDLDVVVWEYDDGLPEGFKRLRRPTKDRSDEPRGAELKAARE